MSKPISIPIVLHDVTYAVLQEVAASWNMTVQDAISNILYRDAATMSGWPGALGSQLRHAVNDVLNPPIANQLELPLGDEQGGYDRE